jgi:Rrf2 family protein
MISTGVKKMAGQGGLLVFSKKIDYGFLFMLELAKSPKKSMSLHTVSKEKFISFFFLQKVASILKKAGLIKAARGSGGGYQLGRPASKISLLEIVEALNGPLALMPCLSQNQVALCMHKNECQVRSGLFFINKTIVNSLKEKFLSDFINPHE